MDLTETQGKGIKAKFKALQSQAMQTLLPRSWRRSWWLSADPCSDSRQSISGRVEEVVAAVKATAD